MIFWHIYAISVPFCGSENVFWGTKVKKALEGISVWSLSWKSLLMISLMWWSWCAVSLTINLGYLPQIWQSPSWVGIINKCSFVLMLQAVLWKRLASDWLALGIWSTNILLSWSSLWNLALLVFLTPIWSNLKLSDSLWYPTALI